MVKHCAVLRRSVHVVNLDPAADQFDYPLLAGDAHIGMDFTFFHQLQTLWSRD